MCGEPRLMGWQGHRTKAGSKVADGEFERRNETRTVYQRLSQYHPLEEGRSARSVPRLLLRGEHGFSDSASGCFTYPISFRIGRP